MLYMIEEPLFSQKHSRHYFRKIHINVIPTALNMIPINICQAPSAQS